MSHGPQEDVSESVYMETKSKLTFVLDGELMDEFFALFLFLVFNLVKVFYEEPNRASCEAYPLLEVMGLPLAKQEPWDPGGELPSQGPHHADLYPA